MATHSVVVDPVEIWEYSGSDTIAREPAWSDWTPFHECWVRRRPRVPGRNDHWGKWFLNRDYNQQVRINPVSNRTHIETAKWEFQFHWNDREPASVTSRDCDARRTGATESSHNHFEQHIRKTKDQGSTIIDESDDLIVFDLDEMGQRAVDIKRSGMEAKHHERDFEESTAAPSELGPKHSSITPHQEPVGRRHRASAITSGKSALASFSGVSAAAVTSTSKQAVMTSTPAAEKAIAIGTWFYGAIMAGVGVMTVRATRKAADATVRSAVAARQTAAAAEESAQAAKRSAQAAEDSAAVMQKQLEIMKQDRQGPPPAGNSSNGSPSDNGGSGTGSVDARSPDVDTPQEQEQQRTRSVSTATPPAPGTASTSGPVYAPQEEVRTGGSPEQIDPVQTPEVAQNAPTGKRRAVSIEATPSARMLMPSPTGMTIANISWPQVPSSDPGGPSVNQNPPKQASSFRTSPATFHRERIRQKERHLRNIIVIQDGLKSRERERERGVEVRRELQELRNRLA